MKFSKNFWTITLILLIWNLMVWVDVLKPPPKPIVEPAEMIVLLTAIQIQDIE